jgi:hypothetical protein
MVLISPISVKSSGIFLNYQTRRCTSTLRLTTATSLFVLECLVFINSIELIALSVCVFTALPTTLSRRVPEILS